MKDQKSANSTLIIEKDTIRKILKESEDFDTVLSKHERLSKIGEDNEFISPEVISFSKAEHSITFNKLDLPRSEKFFFNLCLNSKKNCNTILKRCQRIGEILGIIHKNLILESKKTTSLSESFLKSMKDYSKASSNLKQPDNVYIHGDFSLNNLHFNSSSFIVLDPLPNYHSTFYVNEFSNPLLDLSILCNSILRQLSYKRFWGKNYKLVRKIIYNVIHGYENQLHCKIDRVELGRYCYAVDCAIANKHLSSKFLKEIRKILSKRIIQYALK